MDGHINLHTNQAITPHRGFDDLIYDGAMTAGKIALPIGMGIVAASLGRGVGSRICLGGIGGGLVTLGDLRISFKW